MKGKVVAWDKDGKPLLKEPDFVMPKYTVDQKMLDRLENDFTYHAPTPDQIPRYAALREAGYALALRICELSPPSREQSVALTLLDQVIMEANAAIARNEK